MCIRDRSNIDFRKDTDVSVSIKPLEDRILVKSLEAETTTASGLVIPDTAKEKPCLLYTSGRSGTGSSVASANADLDRERCS